MNSRERVMAAVRRERPDRPATSLRCTEEAWVTLRDHLGVATNQEAMDALDIDLRWVPLPYIGPAERSAVTLASEGVDFWGVRTRKVMNDFNAYYEFDYHPLAHAESVKDIEDYDWPSLDWWDYAAIPAQIAAVNRTGRRACMFFAGGAFETPWYLRGLERFMMDLVECPEIAHAICERVEEYNRQRALRVLAVAGEEIDIIGSGGDIGSQRGMLLNPDLWREHIKPYSGRLISTFKSKGFATYYHSCGSIVPVIDDLIDLGLDILDPIQVSAAGMSPEALAPDFEGRITFHGALDEQELLPHASADEVYRETTRIIGILGRSGGFIVAPSHQVQGDTPPENVVAIFAAARDYQWT